MVKLVEAFRLARSIKRAGPGQFAQHMVPHVIRPAQIIWNKALAAIFMLLAACFFVPAFNYYRALTTAAANPLGLGFAAFLGCVMAAFGVNAWRKATRLERLAALPQVRR